MKQTMKTLIAWTCFWAGDFTSKVLNVIPDAWPEWLHGLFYRAYQLFMHWSDVLDDNNDIWRPQ